MKNIKKILLFLGAVSLIIYGKTNADKLKDGSTGSEVKTVIEEKETVKHLKKRKIHNSKEHRNQQNRLQDRQLKGL